MGKRGSKKVCKSDSLWSHFENLINASLVAEVAAVVDSVLNDRITMKCPDLMLFSNATTMSLELSMMRSLKPSGVRCGEIYPTVLDLLDPKGL